ncbi:MATE family efflux transporter [Lachnospiraceae bacterium 62-35]
MKNKLDLLKGDVKSLYFHYLLPSISATLVTSIYILADTMMIGRGVGPIGIAALNILLPLFSLFFGTGLLFGAGGGVYFSVEKGKKNQEEANRYFTASFLANIAAAVLYLIIFHLFFDEITAFLGKNETMDRLVQEYGRVILAFLPVFMLSSFFQAFVRNDKAPKTAMAAVITGGVLNVVLDYIFIFPMGKGMAGAAAATVIGSAVTVLILLTHFFSPSNTLKIVPCFSIRKAGEAFVSGLSSFMVEMSGGIVIFLFNRQLLAYAGELGVVVYGIISNSAMIVNSVSNGISQAAQPIMAINFGAGAAERVEAARKQGEKAALTAGILFTITGLAWPDLVIQAFVEPSLEITAMAVPAVRLYFLSFLGTGLNLLANTYFQSMLKPGKALLLCLLRGILLSSFFVMVLPHFFGMNGIWCSMLLTEAVTFIVGRQFLFYHIGRVSKEV